MDYYVILHSKTAYPEENAYFESFREKFEEILFAKEFEEEASWYRKLLLKPYISPRANQLLDPNHWIWIHTSITNVDPDEEQDVSTAREKIEDALMDLYQEAERNGRVLFKDLNKLFDRLKSFVDFLNSKQDSKARKIYMTLSPKETSDVGFRKVSETVYELCYNKHLTFDFKTGEIEYKDVNWVVLNSYDVDYNRGHFGTERYLRERATERIPYISQIAKEQQKYRNQRILQRAKILEGLPEEVEKHIYSSTRCLRCKKKYNEGF